MECHASVSHVPLSNRSPPAGWWFESVTFVMIDRRRVSIHARALSLGRELQHFRPPSAGFRWKDVDLGEIVYPM